MSFVSDTQHDSKTFKPIAASRQVGNKQDFIISDSL